VWQAVHTQTLPVFANIDVSGQRPVTIYHAR